MKLILKNWRIVLVFCFAFSLILGGMSIRPFTKLWLPWMLVAQWKRVAIPTSEDLQCKEKLKSLGALFEDGAVPDTDIENGCIIDTPVVIREIGLKINNIAFAQQYDYVALRCEFAVRLQNFIDHFIVPEAIKTFGLRPVAFLHKGGYACRGQSQLTVIKSEHAYGQAIDFAGLRFEDGSELFVEKDYNQESKAGKFLKLVAEKSCKEFGTTLGPAFNELHKDHLHWSIGFPKLCIY